MLEATGGELKGKGFRVAKKAANKRNRINKRATRKAQRRGDQLREGYEGFTNDPEEQKVGKYFENLKTARGDRAGMTAAIVAGTVMTAGAGLAAAGAMGAGAAAAGGGAAAVAGGTAATGLAAGTGATIGLGAGGVSAATGLAGAGTAIGSAAAGTAGLAGASAGTVAAGTAAAGTAGSFIPNALKAVKQVGDVAKNVQKVAGAAGTVKDLFTGPQQEQQPQQQSVQGLGFNNYTTQNTPASNTGASMVYPNSYNNQLYMPPTV